MCTLYEYIVWVHKCIAWIFVKVMYVCLGQSAVGVISFYDLLRVGRVFDAVMNPVTGLCVYGCVCECEYMKLKKKKK